MCRATGRSGSTIKTRTFGRFRSVSAVLHTSSSMWLPQYSCQHGTERLNSAGPQADAHTLIFYLFIINYYALFVCLFVLFDMKWRWCWGKATMCLYIHLITWTEIPSKTIKKKQNKKKVNFCYSDCWSFSGNLTKVKSNPTGTLTDTCIFQDLLTVFIVIFGQWNLVGSSHYGGW